MGHFVMASRIFLVKMFNIKLEALFLPFCNQLCWNDFTSNLKLQTITAFLYLKYTYAYRHIGAKIRLFCEFECANEIAKMQIEL